MQPHWGSCHNSSSQTFFCKSFGSFINCGIPGEVQERRRLERERVKGEKTKN